MKPLTNKRTSDLSIQENIEYKPRFTLRGVYSSPFGYHVNFSVENTALSEKLVTELLITREQFDELTKDGYFWTEEIKNKNVVK